MERGQSVQRALFVLHHLHGNTLSVLLYPEGVDAGLLPKILARGVAVAGGLHPAVRTTSFRIGHMGYVDDFDVTTALAALEQVLQELGHPVDFGASLGAAQKVFAERG